MRFLVARYGFGAPVVTKKNTYGTVLYKKNEIAICGLWDTREQIFEIKVVILDEKGRVPDTYKLNERGEIVNGYIAEFLEPKGIRDLGNRAPKTGDMFDDKIARFVFLAENYALEILQDGSAKNFRGIKSAMS